MSVTQSEDAVATAQGRQRLPRFQLFSPSLSNVIFYAFVSITAVAVLLPLDPTMPKRGIDASYGFAMNQAVARHLSFGRQIVFTYGPYASVVSRVYHPATYLRVMCASLCLGLSYVLATFYLARGRNRYLIVLLLLFLATFGPGELLLLSYPFLLALCVFRYMLFNFEEVSPGWRTCVAAALMWASLGLLPVIKGSLILPFAATVVIPPALLVYRSRFQKALLLFVTPLIACVGLWLLAGQSLRDIPGFLRGTSWLTSGYAEAMSLSWSVLPAAVGNGLVVFYLAVSGIFFLSVARSRQFTQSIKVALCPLLALFLFVPFKHGFVGASAVSSAFASLVLLLLIVQLLYSDRYLKWAVCAAILATAGTSIIRDPGLIKEVHDRFGVGVVANGTGKRRDILTFCIDRALPAYARSTYKRTWNTYRGAWQALASGLGHGDTLNRRFADALRSIRDDDPMPPLKGTVDFYEWDQSVVLASGNLWNPRPVTQSYSAYTPELARLDESHLRGAGAPDWLAFELTPIDGRLPSMDDGLSWPAFLDNYRFISYNSQFILMQRKESLQPASRFSDTSSKTYQTCETIRLPLANGLLFAEVDLKPTLAGKVLTAFLNPPQLKIVLSLDNGQTRSFRVIANMMKTDFLLSPFVGETRDFATLMTNKSSLLPTVRSIAITPSYGGPTYWSGTYELTLKTYMPQ